MRRPAVFDPTESERLAALRSLCLLDSPADPEFDLITEIAAKAFAAPIAVVSLVDEHRLWFKSRVGLDVREIPRESTFCSFAILGAEPTVVLDTHLDDRFVESPLVTGSPHARFYAGAPLITAAGLCIGTLCVLDVAARPSFTATEREMLRSLARLVMVRIETLRTIGFVDPLTLLPNRTRFLEDVALWRTDDPRRVAGRTVIAVDLCGVDFFYGMVRALGCEHAESYLVAAQQRLSSLQPASPVYRVGETLFAFVHDRQDDPPLPMVFRNLTAAFDRPVERLGIPYTATLSIGAVRLTQCDEAGDLLRSLITAADMARQQGGDGSRYERAHDDAQRRAFLILAALAEALTAPDQLSLRYQPRVHLASGVCVGVEALLRWRHPVLGDIPPAEFVPLAEKTALMARVTQWVLEHALRQAAEWQRAGHRFTLSINVSATDLDQSDFVAAVAALIEREGLDATLLEIEFTESAMSTRQERLGDALAGLRTRGLQIAIDDFGAGYSNFGYLKRFPATTLKIDQSFIRTLLTDERDSTIVPSMIALGHALGHRVVGEGIESKEIQDLLSDWGCDEGQGYWISMPLVADELERWLQERARAARFAQAREAARHANDRRIEARYFCTSKRSSKNRVVRG